MVVNNYTKVDGNTIIKDLENSYLRNQISTFVLQALIIACGIAMLVTGAITDVVATMAMGAVFAVLGLIYLVYTIFRVIKEKKEIPLVNKTVYENGCDFSYKFKQESIFVEFTTGTKHIKYESKYTDVKKVYELPTKYEIILRDGTRLYADKAGFENAKMIEFFLKNLAINKKKVRKQYR